MKGELAKLNLLVLCTAVVTSACVTSGTHEAVVRDLEATSAELQSTTAELTLARDEARKEADDCMVDLATAVDHNSALATKVASMGQDVQQLLGEKGELAEEKARLLEERDALSSEVAQLQRMRAAAEVRNAEYRLLLKKLHKMIDAGTLAVKVRNGRMLVQMSSDVVFPPGGTRIRKAAREALIELAQTLSQFPDRHFQVMGHSDSTPISTARFPSNWELSSQRAIEVVKLLVEAGVSAEMLSAAGSAEFDPLVDEINPEDKAMNRRVEVVFLPKIDELPGYSVGLLQVDQGASEQQASVDHMGYE